MMGFLGNIDSMMKGSGLQEVLETVYGHNAVTHNPTCMISVKAVSRALLGHFNIVMGLCHHISA